MRLNVRLSAMTAMLCALVTLLIRAGSALSYFRLHQQRLDRQLTAMADSFNRLMLTEPLSSIAPWLPLAMDSAGITQLTLKRQGETVYRPAKAKGSATRYPIPSGNGNCTCRDILMTGWLSPTPTRWSCVQYIDFSSPAMVIML